MLELPGFDETYVCSFFCSEGCFRLPQEYYDNFIWGNANFTSNAVSYFISLLISRALTLSFRLFRSLRSTVHFVMSPVTHRSCAKDFS